MYRTVLTLFSLLSICTLSAQTEHMEANVRALFNKPEKIKWVQHYHGLFDELNEVAITLASDGKVCKGQMIYLQSKEQFWLNGSLKKNWLKLQEVDTDLQVTGYLQGEYNNGVMELDWSNHDHSLGGTISLKRLNQAAKTLKSLPSKKWLRNYKGIAFGKTVELLLQNDGQNGLRGVAYFIEDHRSYSLKGDLLENGSLKLYLRNSHSKAKGNIEGIMKKDGQISANFYNTEGRRSPTILSMEESIPLHCTEYADYISVYDITYPQTQHQDFNRWISNIAQQWLSNCQKHSQKVRLINQNPDPKLRSSVRAYAWSDVDIYTDRLISGFITFDNTWTLEPQGKAFNYDFVQKREITLEDIFVDNFDHQEFVHTYINQEIGQHKYYKDFEYRNWLAKQRFPFFTIRKDGICFSTFFDTLYGQQKIIVPFSRLKPYLKTDSPIGHLLMDH